MYDGAAEEWVMFDLQTKAPPVGFDLMMLELPTEDGIPVESNGSRAEKVKALWE